MALPKVRLLITGHVETLTLAAAVAHYENYVAQDSQLNTARAKRSDLAVLAAYIDRKQKGGCMLTELTESALRSFIEYRTKFDKPSTINRRMATIKHFCAFLANQFPTWSDPARNLHALRLPDTTPDWFKDDEVVKLRDAVETYGKTAFERTRAAVIVELGLSLGFRVFETAELLMLSLNFSKKLIQNFRRKANRWSTKPMAPRVEAALNDYLPERELYLTAKCRGYKKLSELDKKKYPVIVSACNATTDPRSWGVNECTVRRIFKALAEEADVDDARNHRMRHAFCHTVQKATTDLRLTARLADHSSVQTTMRYVEPSEDELRNALEKIETED